MEAHRIYFYGLNKIKIARQGLFTITDRDQNSLHIRIVRVESTIDYFLQD